MDKDAIRKEIDAIDTQILDLLSHRIEYAKEIGKMKAANGEEIYVPSRETLVFKKLSDKNGGRIDEAALRSIYREIISASISAEKRLMVGHTVLDAEEMSAYVGGEEVALTVREFNILYKLLSYPRRTFSRAQLMDEFWSGDSSASMRAVDVYITRIRDKFSACEDFKIVTVHGLGYKAVPAV